MVVDVGKKNKKSVETRHTTTIKQPAKNSAATGASSYSLLYCMNCSVSVRVAAREGVKRSSVDCQQLEVGRGQFVPDGGHAHQAVRWVDHAGSTNSHKASTASPRKTAQSLYNVVVVAGAQEAATDRVDRAVRVRSRSCSHSRSRIRPYPWYTNASPRTVIARLCSTAGDVSNRALLTSSLPLHSTHTRMLLIGMWMSLTM
jgi:hypothetical protein